MQSQQPGAQHAQNSGDDRGLQEKPPGSPPTHHHEQHCDCSGVIQIAGQHHLSGPEVGYSHRLHCQKGPAEVALSSPAEEVQPATGLTETVLLRHHWIHPLHFYNCLVQLKSDLRRLRRVVRTAERIIGTTLPTFQELYLSRASKRLVKSLWTLTSSTLPLWTVTVWPTLQSSEHQNDQTQTQFLPSGNTPHEHSTINVEH